MAGKLKDHIDKYKEIAKIKNGECLSSKYLGINEKLEFKCYKGHIWKTRAFNISVRNRWCPECAPNRKLKLEDAIKFASDNDGYCLSTKYKSVFDKLVWKCKFGHTWKSTFVSTKNSKGWCPQCTGKFFSENIVRSIFEQLTGFNFPKSKLNCLKLNNGKYLELDGYCQELSVAFEHHGLQHYEKTYFHKNKKSFEQAQKRDLLKLEICRNNNIKIIIIPDLYSKTGIDNIVNLVKSELKIFDKEINISEIINIQKCNKNNNINEKIKKLVLSKGGKLISEFKSSKHKINIECGKGHTWQALWNNINSGTWCPLCYKEKRDIKCPK